MKRLRDSNDLVNPKIKYMAKKEFSFNDAVIEIEDILKKIESGQLDVDKLSVEVKRASELIKLCQKKLRSTEDEINSIFKDLV
jgi:exodeoxyribonuclease VII small subunit